MSNLCRRMAKPKKVCPRKKRQAMHKFCNEHYKYYTSFNVFTKQGENLTVEAPRPMTIYEARIYFNVLCISGIE